MEKSRELPGSRQPRILHNAESGAVLVLISSVYEKKQF